MGNCKSAQKTPDEVKPATYQEQVKNEAASPLIPSKASVTVISGNHEVEASQTDLTLADSNASSINPAQTDASANKGGDDDKADYLQFDPYAKEDESALDVSSSSSSDQCEKEPSMEEEEEEEEKEEKEEKSENEKQIVPSAKSSPETYRMVIPMESTKPLGLGNAPVVIPAELSKPAQSSRRMAFPVLKGQPEFGKSLNALAKTEQKSKWALPMSMPKEATQAMDPLELLHSVTPTEQRKSSWALSPGEMPNGAFSPMNGETKNHLAIEDDVKQPQTEQPQTEEPQTQQPQTESNSETETKPNKRRSKRAKEERKKGDGVGYPPNFMANW